jgi:hypothetical protein
LTHDGHDYNDISRYLETKLIHQVKSTTSPVEVSHLFPATFNFATLGIGNQLDMFGWENVESFPVDNAEFDTRASALVDQQVATATNGQFLPPARRITTVLPAHPEVNSWVHAHHPLLSGNNLVEIDHVRISFNEKNNHFVRWFDSWRKKFVRQSVSRWRSIGTIGSKNFRFNITNLRVVDETNSRIALQPGNGTDEYVVRFKSDLIVGDEPWRTLKLHGSWPDYTVSERNVNWSTFGNVGIRIRPDVQELLANGFIIESGAKASYRALPIQNIDSGDAYHLLIDLPSTTQSPIVFYQKSASEFEGKNLDCPAGTCEEVLNYSHLRWRLTAELGHLPLSDMLSIDHVGCTTTIESKNIAPKVRITSQFGEWRQTLTGTYNNDAKCLVSVPFPVGFHDGATHVVNGGLLTFTQCDGSPGRYPAARYDMIPGAFQRTSYSVLTTVLNNLPGIGFHRADEIVTISGDNFVLTAPENQDGFVYEGVNFGNYIVSTEAFESMSVTVDASLDDLGFKVAIDIATAYDSIADETHVTGSGLITYPGITTTAGVGVFVANGPVPSDPVLVPPSLPGSVQDTRGCGTIDFVHWDFTTSSVTQEEDTDCATPGRHRLAFTAPTGPGTLTTSLWASATVVRKVTNHIDQFNGQTLQAHQIGLIPTYFTLTSHPLKSSVTTDERTVSASIVDRSLNQQSVAISFVKTIAGRLDALSLPTLEITEGGLSGPAFQITTALETEVDQAETNGSFDVRNHQMTLESGGGSINVRASCDSDEVLTYTAATTSTTNAWRINGTTLNAIKITLSPATNYIRQP